jgi:hypothetical protein
MCGTFGVVIEVRYGMKDENTEGKEYIYCCGKAQQSTLTLKAQ